MACEVCLVVEQASEPTKDELIRRQAVTIDRLRSNLDTFRLAAANGRIRELEEMLERVNRSNPRGMATEVVRELALMDPRSNDGDQSCFFCCVKGSRHTDHVPHRKDCLFKRAVVAAEVLAKDERRRRTA